MKRRSILRIQLLLAAMIFASCTPDNKSQEKLSPGDFAFIKINNEYGMNIPTYMKKSTNLNEEASMQFANIFKGAFMIVIDESKEEFINLYTDLGEYNDSVSVVENYRDIQLKLLDENMEILWRSASRSATINQLDAELIQIDGRVDDIEHTISYTLGFIEGNEKMYMVMAWTLVERKQKYEDTFNKSIKSFRLLN